MVRKGSNSIEQLKNDILKEPVEYPSGLVINCHNYRKIPIKQLTVEQLRLLISQKIGLEHIIEIAIQKLEENILAEGDLYEGDLLVAVSCLSTQFWNENKIHLEKLRTIVEFNIELIIAELGERKCKQLNERLKLI